MRVHLIKDSYVSSETFSEVIRLLQGVPGPIHFISDTGVNIDFLDEESVNGTVENSVEFEKKSKSKNLNYLLNLELDEVNNYREYDFPLERNTVSWDTIFEKCNLYRSVNNKPVDEFVLLLTEMSNDKNWFACLDESMPFNGFIHTGDWNYYIKCRDAFPVAYEVIALLLQKHMFTHYSEIEAMGHKDPIGCVNDICFAKKEIILKLRTADICADCMQKLSANMGVTEIQHALKLMESLRVKMLYSQNFKQAAPLSKLVVDEKNRIFLPDFGNIEIVLTPLEKALYFLVLRHPEGIGLSYLRRHRQELIGLYKKTNPSESEDNVISRIENLIDITTNSSAEKIAKIKRGFVRAIGDELAKHYYIKGANGEAKKVDLDRGLVINKF